MEFAFVTCVKLGLSCMESIYEAGGKLNLVVTLKDEMARNKSGRVYVDDFCAKNGIDVMKIRNINDAEVVEALKTYNIDWLFIIGWSQIAHTPILNATKYGVVGMHPTLLPVGRGRASIPWAILKGLSETGVTLFKLDEGVDTGLIIAQEIIPMTPNETATVLYDKVCRAHSTLIHRVWSDFKENTVSLMSQDNSKASEWPGRMPEDSIILPNMTVEEVEKLVRATTHPYPGAFWKESGKVIRIWKGIIGVQGTASSKGTRRLFLKNGVYDALEYDVE